MLAKKDSAVCGGILENVFARNVQMDNITGSSAPYVMYIVGFPGLVIDGIKFFNCVFKGVEETEVVASSGSIEFRTVFIEPKNKTASLARVPSPSDQPEMRL